jgi:hypothetical protein
VGDACQHCRRPGHASTACPCACDNVHERPWRGRSELLLQYVCVIDPSDPRCRGETGDVREDKRCSGCGGAAFTYRNGHEFSREGVRGYRCMSCGTIKPEERCGDCGDARGNGHEDCPAWDDGGTPGARAGKAWPGLGA